MNNINKKRVLIIGRAVRTADIFAKTAECLQKNCEVLVSYGYYIEDSYHIQKIQESEQIWRTAKGVPIVNLYEEIVSILKKIENPEMLVPEIEEELGLNLYSAATNYLLYAKLKHEFSGERPEYYKTESEIVKNYVGSFYAIKSILDNFIPDVILYETPDHISSVIAMQMGRQRGIFSFGFSRPTLIGQGNFLLTHGTNRQSPLLDYYFNHEQQIPGEYWQKAEGVLEKLEEGIMPIFSHLDAKIKNFSNQKNSFFKRIFQLAHYSHPVKSVSQYQNKKWLYNRMATSDPSRKYILYFMHNQPEATTCSHAPRWVDQRYIIERLSLTAPYGYDVILREHPRNLGGRGKSYYAPLLDLPNVKLQHPTYPREKLIANAAAIVTITGSVGMEGALLGKIVGTLSRPFYSMMDNVHELSKPEEIYKLLDKEVDQARNRLQALKFLASLMASSFFMGAYEPGKVFPPADQAGPNLAKGLEMTYSKIREWDIIPDMIDPGEFIEWSPGKEKPA